MVKAIGTRKLIDRLIIALAFSVLLIIVMLVFHINMYMQLSKHPLASNTKYTHIHPVVQHNKADFRRNFQFHESDSDTHDRGMDSSQVVAEPTDTFQDLHDAIETLENDSVGSFQTNVINSSPVVTLGDLLQKKITDETTSLELFHSQITSNEMYPENSPAVEQLLADMSRLPIHKVEEMEGGTQFKLKITFRNGMRALFKPKRLELNQQDAPNQAYYSVYERHNAEIAAFHIDRLLGYRRALPTVGRTMNAITDIMRVASTQLKRTFFKSPKPDENICVTGNCEQFCDYNHPVCADGDQLDGSMMAFLPDDDDADKRTNHHPYKRTYRASEQAEWETNPNFCEKVKDVYPLKNSRHLLDFIDTAILDFLIGNLDRHNYQQFRVFNNSFHMHYDHGRSFGRAFFDDFSILAPVTQCCVIRSSTLKTLLSYHHGPTPLSVALRESLSKDPIAPVLWQPHLQAVDRRIELILEEVRKCLTEKPIKNVIIFS